MHSVFDIIAIGLAGATGAIARHTVAVTARRLYGEAFPWGTLAINLSGAFMIGLFTGMASHAVVTAVWRSVLVIGFLGGYTTFSTLMLEIVRLRRAGNRRVALVYLAASSIGGPLLSACGLWIAR